ncbi:helix-turn-helix domain-containing protein [Lacticaseibacillus jixianensis]|uniref:Helix-turn-helix domain-containing protein n=1 Tax=Lacticaseibacillus jixianensis TaxID=2486012 RepID=A0ABW4BAQ3_9LACO|nr:helix-turn-helix transcriptional regulator [Lacticaseibacillus jixianensis]
MNKLQPALRIKGENVRHFRKLRGLSQAELAEGICTQATISLIEKHNKVPSMNILIRIVNRLGVTLDDVVVENQDHIQQALSAVEGKIRHGDYQEAAPLLAKIKQGKLTREEDEKRYYYYAGMVELFEHKDVDEAIYDFGRVLNGSPISYRDVAGIMATLGLGLAYAEKGTTDRARVYIDETVKLLKEVPLNESRYQDVELTMYWHIGRIYFEIGEYRQALGHLQTGIELAVRNDSLFRLPELYTLKAQTLAKLGDDQAGAQRAIALALAQVTHRPKLIAELEDPGTADSVSA